MSSKDVAKQGCELAEKELKEKQVQEVKNIVLKTLEKVDKLSKERKELDEQIRILKLDLEDLKEGKLDRIVERQEKDEKAKQTSVVIIIKEKEVIREIERSPWYWPYTVLWQTPYVPYITSTFQCGEQQAIWNGTAPTVLGSDLTSLTATNSIFNPAFHSINCSVAKDASIGTYALEDKSVVHLR